MAAASRRKLCLFVLCDVAEFEMKLVEDVYVFDLDRIPSLLDVAKLTPVASVLRLITEKPTARCVINSRLYLFDSYNLTVRCHDLLERASEEPNVVHMNTMELCSQMRGLKRSPHAIATRDGRRIVVFSTWIEQRHEKGFVDVEVYDPANGTSLEMPPFPRLDDKSHRFNAYYFVNQTTFVLHMDDLPLRTVLTIDLSPNQVSYEWKVNRNSGIPNLIAFDAFVVGDTDTMVVSQSGLYDISRECFFGEFPHNPILEKELLPRGRLVTVTNNTLQPEICIFYLDRDCEYTAEYLPVYLEVHEIDPSTVFHETDINITCGGGGGGGGRGRGRGRRSWGRDRVVKGMELKPTRIKTYGFELRMQYNICVPYFACPDQATVG